MISYVNTLILVFNLLIYKWLNNLIIDLIKYYNLLINILINR